MATTFVHRIDRVEIITRNPQEDGFQFRSVVCYQSNGDSMKAVFTADLNANACVVKNTVCDDIRVNEFISASSPVGVMLANEPTATIKRDNPHSNTNHHADTLEIDTPEHQVLIFLNNGASVLWCYRATTPPNVELS
jgi:hypothetical protein